MRAHALFEEVEPRYEDSALVRCVAHSHDCARPRPNTPAKVTVTQTSNHNTFSYAYKPGSVVLPGSKVDQQLEQALDDAGIKNAQANCPSSVPVKPDTTVTCPVALASGAQATVSFEFSNSSGTVDSSSVKES